MIRIAEMHPEYPNISLEKLFPLISILREVPFPIEHRRGEFNRSSARTDSKGPYRLGGLCYSHLKGEKLHLQAWSFEFQFHRRRILFHTQRSPYAISPLRVGLRTHEQSFTIANLPRKSACKNFISDTSVGPAISPLAIT